MGVETNGANILNTFNMKEHFDGLFFAKKKSTVTEVTLGKDLTSLELVIACNLDKVTVGSKVLINYNNAVMSAVVADKYTIQGDPFILLFIEFDGFKAFEIHTYHNHVVLVATHFFILRKSQRETPQTSLFSSFIFLLFYPSYLPIFPVTYLLVRDTPPLL